MYIQWICGSCKEINSNNNTKNSVCTCGACGKKKNINYIKKYFIYIITNNLSINNFKS